MKRRLFNRYEAFTEEANDLSNKLCAAVEPILKNASNKFPLRDIEIVAVSSIGMITSEMIIRTAIAKAEFEENSSIDHREELGITVRSIWIEWAESQPNINSERLLSWYELPESQKEVARKIGEELFNLGLQFQNK